jgi:hypothetical protein
LRLACRDIGSGVHQGSVSSIPNEPSLLRSSRPAMSYLPLGEDPHSGTFTIDNVANDVTFEVLRSYPRLQQRDIESSEIADLINRSPQQSYSWKENASLGTQHARSIKNSACVVKGLIPESCAISNNVIHLGHVGNDYHDCARFSATLLLVIANLVTHHCSLTSTSPVSALESQSLEAERRFISKFSYCVYA